MTQLRVIIPAYNAESFISECINSILKQGVELSIVVVDDASTDKTLMQLALHKNIKVIKNSRNMGTYHSINVGLSYLKDDPTWTHYTIHGADDVSLPNRFNQQLFKFNQNILASGCAYSRVDKATRKKVSSNFKTNESTLIFSRKVFDEIGFYDTFRCGCDTEYKSRLLCAFPNSIATCSEILIHSYLHKNNLTKKVPLGGKIRNEYVRNFKLEHLEMKKKNSYYKDFKL